MTKNSHDFATRVLSSLAAGMLMYYFFQADQWGQRILGLILLGIVLFLAQYLEQIVQIIKTAAVILLILFALDAIVRPDWFSMLLSQPTPQHYIIHRVRLPDRYLNDSLAEHFTRGPQGETTLGGIPFYMEQNGAFIRTEDEHAAHAPTQIDIPVDINKPHTIFMLTNLSYGCKKWAPKGSSVGQVVFVFDNGHTQVEPLKTGLNVREWVVEADEPPAYCSVVNDVTDPAVQKAVWSSRVKISNKLAVMDLVTFTVLEAYREQKLVQVTVYDTSKETAAGSVNPSVLLFGMSVAATE